jgi:hypothetical protein
LSLPDAHINYDCPSHRFSHTAASPTVDNSEHRPTSVTMAKKLTKPSSDPSPSPELLEAQVEPSTAAKTAPNGKKRKASSGAAPTPKRTKKAAPRKKKQVDTAPLEERTTDIDLNIGAHVSVAGG